jgi:NAD(P)-dependent dehydrogenase (short-subunit alcohol dehydrogenase family)
MTYGEGAMTSVADSRVAVVTGAGGGMGSCVATALAASGVRVVLNDRREEPLAAQAEALRSAGHEPLVVVGDVSTPGGAAALIDMTLSTWARIDILVNVAGGVKGPLTNPLWEMTDEQWDGTVAANLGTTYHCTRRAVPSMMRQRSGKIVNIASISWAGDAERAHYAAAKAGVVAFTRSVATQLGPYNINVNAIAPGGTLTHSKAQTEVSPDAWPMTPLGRPNVPDDISGAVLFLISPAARNVSGELLTVAGGLNPSL